MNRQRVLDICESYESYKENPPNSNLTIFGKWFGMDGQPWCAMSVSKILFEAGNPFPAIQTPGKGADPQAVGAAYVPYIYEYFKAKGKLVATPQPADVVIYDWNHDKSGDHIGFFIAWVIPGKSFLAWEGNQSATDDSNGGEFGKRVRYVSQVLGFINPDNEL